MSVIKAVVAMFKMIVVERNVGGRAFLLIVHHPAVEILAVLFLISHLYKISRSSVAHLSALPSILYLPVLLHLPVLSYFHVLSFLCLSSSHAVTVSLERCSTNVCI